MRIIKMACSVLILCLTLQMNAQETKNQTGLMKATVTHKMAYIKDGVKRPYKVTVRERRTSIAKFDKEDMGKIDQDRIPTPEDVLVLLTISNPLDSFDDRVIAMRYDKQVNDTFDLESTDTGFLVNVEGKKMEYVMGKGIHFPNAADEEFLKCDEFEVMK